MIHEINEIARKNQKLTIHNFHTSEQGFHPLISFWVRNQHFFHQQPLKQKCNDKKNVMPVKLQSCTQETIINQEDLASFKFLQEANLRGMQQVTIQKISWQKVIFQVTNSTFPISVFIKICILSCHCHFITKPKTGKLILNYYMTECNIYSDMMARQVL